VLISSLTTLVAKLPAGSQKRNSTVTSSHQFQLKEKVEAARRAMLLYPQQLSWNWWDDVTVELRFWLTAADRAASRGALLRLFPAPARIVIPAHPPRRTATLLAAGR
jgi:hypothetical protein